jgi:uncharacterized protein YfaS (alpha-2-macroglobulin family)
VRQGERVVVVVSGSPAGVRTHPSVFVDLLPAGLEIESILGPQDTLSGTNSDGTPRRGPFAWVGEVTGHANVTEARDDRFVAAADIRGVSFRFAYVARAVTPGNFTLPAAQVEDMYRPGVFARTGVGRIRIAPSGE